MVWSLVPLLLICVVIAGVAGSCNWGFGGKAGEQRIPDFNSAAAFRADAQTMPFPIREPAVPQDWKSNSGSTGTAGSSLVSNVGWIAGSGAYVQLSQSAATEEQLVRAVGGEDVIGTGTREAGERTWVTYENPVEHRKVWVTDLGDVRIAVLTRGDEALLSQLAAATLRAQPLPSGR